MRTTRIASPLTLPWHLGMPFEAAYALAGTPREYGMVVGQEAAALAHRLYAASTRIDPALLAPALDQLLVHVESAEDTAPIFDALDPWRLARAVGQTLLAATRGNRSPARQAFAERFLAALRGRGEPEAILRRMEALR